MRIEDVEVINLRFDYPTGNGFRYAGGTVTSRVTSLVRVHTDSGLVGLGAAYSHPDLVRVIIEGNLRSHLIGEDPLQVEALWEKMYGLTRWYGRKGAALSAIGGIDIALWDLRGKAAGQPVYRLLGGERGVAPAYASGLFWQDDVAAIEQEAARHRQRGFRRVKMRLGRSEDYDVAAVAAARRGVGADGDVMVDGSHRYSAEVAERMGSVLAEHRVFWFEEPFPPEDLDAYVALRPRLTVPLAAGENEFGAQGFREIIRAGAVDIAQPDACRTGGITESMRVARLAAEHGVRIAPHTWSDAVAVMANAHVVASIPHGVTVEVDQTGNPSIDDLLSEPLRIEDGILQLPDRPGLGIELYQATVDRLAVPKDQLMLDGNYSDLTFGRQYYHAEPPYQTSAARGR
ncbi:MAG: mandelate racemase/muconate lactonizing enzyme family protein [Candidatus Dormibacteraeota bacterium]|nr:mandelate racemase/muconate lactonizing enzyme family protein [Candidatus Dormibacteraeota bacterium]